MSFCDILYAMSAEHGFPIPNQRLGLADDFRRNSEIGLASLKTPLFSRFNQVWGKVTGKKGDFRNTSDLEPIVMAQKPKVEAKKPDYNLDLQKISMDLGKTSPTTLEGGASIRVKLTVPERLVTVFDFAKHFVKPEYKSKSEGLIYQRSF